jgi:hypothetical protein
VTFPPVDTPLLLPIGQLVGAQRSGYDAPARGHEVRVGSKVHELSTVEFTAWALAHGDPEPAAEATDPPRPWGRAEVAARLRDSGVLGRTGAQAAADPVTLIDALLERGMLAETPTHGPAAVAFARAHRLTPTLLGLGNSATDQWMFSIGLLGQEVVQVGRAMFELWAWGPVDPDLWTVCESFTEQERAAGGTDPDTTEPGAVLAAFLGSVHILLGAQAGYLDVSGG